MTATRNAQTQAGLSRGNKSKRMAGRVVAKHKRVKKMSEKQKIETLERHAADYIAPEGLRCFAELPISEPTRQGLKKAFFIDMTDIQAKSLPVSLKGKDILGAARTGSGKTLAFLVPVLETLYRRKWGPSDGLGALIISPTRELAVQIFDVLRSIGGHHTFSAGLVIGGKNLKDEKDRLARMNILVATPGRLLQHMDQTVGFESDNLQILVLDEADRILDMGFSRTLSALLSHLPRSRQTLLFSATQTQSVGDLARLSLKDPVHISVHESSAGSCNSTTPQNLEQHYITCTLDKKLDILWGFIKSHLQSKVLVFMSSCKQVRFVFETFCKMQPGISLLHLHGKQKQTARLAMYSKFTSSSHAVLFATDIAARGLDFPSVDWVLQLDAPEDAETYIHRVGRTARYESKGKGLLFLLPSEEEGMKSALDKKGIQVQKIKIRSSKTQSIENQLQNLAFQDPEVKYLGQRAFVSYLRSIYLHKDKAIFKLDQLPVERFAESLGLPGAPKIKFLSKGLAKNSPRMAAAAQAEVFKEDEVMEEGNVDGSEEKGFKEYSSSEAEEDGDEGEDEEDEEDEDDSKESETTAATMAKTTTTKPSKSGAVRTRYDRMFERKNQNILSRHYSKLIDHESDHDDGDDFITLKRANHDLPDCGLLDSSSLSKRKLKMGNAKRAIANNGLGKKLVFDEEGNPHELYELADPEDLFKEKGGLEGVKAEGKIFAEGERGRMRQADVVDKEEAREKKREKKRKRKDRENGLGDDETVGPIVGPLSDDDGYVSPEFDFPDRSLDGGDDREEDWDTAPPPAKLAKTSTGLSIRENSRLRSAKTMIEDDEELALQLLRKR